MTVEKRDPNTHLLQRVASGQTANLQPFQLSNLRFEIQFFEFHDLTLAESNPQVGLWNSHGATPWLRSPTRRHSHPMKSHLSPAIMCEKAENRQSSTIRNAFRNWNPALIFRDSRNGQDKPRGGKFPACHCCQKKRRFRQSMPRLKSGPSEIQTKSTDSHVAELQDFTPDSIRADFRAKSTPWRIRIWFLQGLVELTGMRLYERKQSHCRRMQREPVGPLIVSSMQSVSASARSSVGKSNRLLRRL